MARTLKGTRARGLPAKVLLSQRQDATGSFPTVWRTSSDNRTGKYPVFFNDNKVINFNQPVTDVGLPITVNGIVYPLVMTSQAIDAGLTTEAKNDLYKQPYFSGSVIVNQPIVASGSMVNGVSDLFVTFTPGQDVEPFMDFANPEVDGKLSASVGGVNPFYATGSAIAVTGLGFQQPLWSKNKIEIDITPTAEQTISLNNTGSSGNYPMNYWNPSTKQYEGIGTGRGIWSGFGNAAPSDTVAIQGLLENQMFGFGASIDKGANSLTPEKSTIYGRQISTFGFPYHSKFQPTASQQIQMDSYISEPFLLEKLVLEFSGALQTIHPSYGTSSAIWTFFLLNSRSIVPNKQSESQTIKYTNFNTGASTLQTSSFLGNTYLDLVDYFQVAFTGSFSDSIEAINRELIITPTELSSPLRYVNSSQMVLSSSVKSSLKYDGAGFYATRNASDQTIVVSQSLNVSGRNELFNANGRDWKTTFEANQLTGITISPIPGTIDATETNVVYTKPNPYLLLPSDKITFGFQLPWSSTMGYLNYQVTSSIDFSTTGINKIILYGSTLRVNPETNQLEEYHDTLNQLLSSNSVHEVIGE